MTLWIDQRKHGCRLQLAEQRGLTTLAHGGTGHPWWGRTYSMALEPWSSWPGKGLAAAVAEGTALTLAPGQSVETRLSAALWTGGGPVARVGPEGVVRAREV